MTCLTPSNPDSIPFGESLDITDSLSLTSGGSLFPDGRSMADFEADLPTLPVPTGLSDLDVYGETHRVDDVNFLVAQTVAQPAGITKLWRESQEDARRAKLGLPPRRTGKPRRPSSSSTKASSAAAEGSADTDAAPKKRKSLRYEDDAELLPLPSTTSSRKASASSKTGSAARRTAAPSKPSQPAEEEEDEDEDGWDEPDGDDFYEKLLPDEVKRKFSVHIPASRAQV
jgi:DNA polymerase gamma 1